MAKITEDKLEKAIDHVEGLSDKAYEKLIDVFEKEQPELGEFFNNKLEDLDSEEERNDVITIMMILYYVISTENPNLFIVSEKTIESCENRNNEIQEEIKEITKTSELIDDEDLSMSFIANRAMHNFVLATLDPNEPGSPFEEETSDKAYQIIKVCTDCLAAAI
jgi:hypothetical protein